MLALLRVATLQQRGTEETLVLVRKVQASSRTATHDNHLQRTRMGALLGLPQTLISYLFSDPRPDPGPSFTNVPEVGPDRDGAVPVLTPRESRKRRRMGTSVYTHCDGKE